MQNREFLKLLASALFVLVPSTVFAYISIQEGRTFSEFSEKNTEDTQRNFSLKQPHPSLNQKKQKGHQLNLSLALRRLDVDDYSYSQFNNQKIQNIQEKAINDISFDWGLSYHYRPALSYSLGLAFHRIQINSQSIDLRYASLDPIPPAPETLNPIASDLITDDLSIGQFYRPQSVFDRAYNYEVVARAYIMPAQICDPFLQATVGYTHHNSEVIRQDTSIYRASHDQFWTWSIGTGCSVALSQNIFFEPSLLIRNLNSFVYSDDLQSINGSNKYGYTVTASRYYSLDLHFSLITRW